MTTGTYWFFLSSIWMDISHLLTSGRNKIKEISQLFLFYLSSRSCLDTQGICSPYIKGKERTGKGVGGGKSISKRLQMLHKNVPFRAKDLKIVIPAVEIVWFILIRPSFAWKVTLSHAMWGVVKYHGMTRWSGSRNMVSPKEWQLPFSGFLNLKTIFFPLMILKRKYFQMI